MARSPSQLLSQTDRRTYVRTRAYNLHSSAQLSSARHACIIHGRLFLRISYLRVLTPPPPDQPASQPATSIRQPAAISEDARTYVRTCIALLLSNPDILQYLCTNVRPFSLYFPRYLQLFYYYQVFLLRLTSYDCTYYGATITCCARHIGSSSIDRVGVFHYMPTNNKIQRVAISQRKNIKWFDRHGKKVLVLSEPMSEYRQTTLLPLSWQLGNKSVLLLVYTRLVLSTSSSRRRHLKVE